MVARLEPRLPVAVPVPLAMGQPGLGYPYPWLIYSWLEGEDLQDGPVADFGELAREIATFVRALQTGPEEGPPAGRRGGSLASFDDVTRSAIEALEGRIDVDRALAVWGDAIAADPWGGPPRWVHGDLLPGNILVRNGHLCGVIDWSATGLGDPACDAMVAWSLPPAARAAFGPPSTSTTQRGHEPRLDGGAGGTLHPVLRGHHSRGRGDC